MAGPRSALLPVETLTPTLERVALADLRPHPRNYQQHTADELAHLRASIRLHNIYKNIVIARDNTILAGHGVVEAAAQEGHTHILAARKDYDPLEPRALQILAGDNEIARLVLKQDDALATLLQELSQDDPAALLGTGFDADTLAALVEAQQMAMGDGAGTSDAGRDVEPQTDRGEELRELWEVELGSLWALGDHRLICGDCTDKVVVERLLGKTQTSLVLTDPPYGIDLDTAGLSLPGGWDGSAARAPKARLRRYQKIAGDAMPFDPSQLLQLFHGCPEVFLWGGNYFADRLPRGAWFVWDKTAGGTLQTLGHEFELCWSKARHRGQILRYRWAGVHGMEAEDTEMRVHPAQKPVPLTEWFVEAYSVQGDVVADFYMGSGTTLIACENLGRTCYGADIDPGYVATTLQRYADLTGNSPQRLEG